MPAKLRNIEDLAIFEDFLLDTNLPKHKDTGIAEHIIEDGRYEEQSTMLHLDDRKAAMLQITYFRSLTSLHNHRDGIVNNRNTRWRSSSWTTKIANWFHDKKESIIDKITPTKKVESVFKEIVSERLVLEKDKKHIKEFQALITTAENAGQADYAEKLKYELAVYYQEMKLYKAGFLNYVTEAQMIKALTNADKKFRLDWIQNFNRSIPAPIVKVKTDLDNELKAFDNYIIMHYDPFNKNDVMTKTQKKKEIEKAKDPILFGVIAGSRKLYVIADWIDEYCDLTFDKLTDMTDTEKLQYAEYQLNNGSKVEIFKLQDPDDKIWTDEEAEDLKIVFTGIKSKASIHGPEISKVFGLLTDTDLM